MSVELLARADPRTVACRTSAGLAGPDYDKLEKGLEKSSVLAVCIGTSMRSPTLPSHPRFEQISNLSGVRGYLFSSSEVPQGRVALHDSWSAVSCMIVTVVTLFCFLE